MNARFYVKSIGRFASADTIIPSPNDPQSHNRYSYVLNNPLKFIDPTGHCAEYGDDACWSTYDQIVNICPECINYYVDGVDGVGDFKIFLDEMNYDQLRVILGWVQDGWRPTLSGFDYSYDILAGLVSEVELSGDVYNQVLAILDRADEEIPGKYTVGLVILQAGLENKDEGLARIGYEILVAIGIDLIVDAIAGYAAVNMGASYLLIGGPSAAGVGVIAGGATFVLVQGIYEKGLSSHVDAFFDSLFVAGSQFYGTGLSTTPVPAARRTPFYVPPAPIPSPPSPPGTPTPPWW